ncbi:MAG: hypothetical protein R2824_22165 [Saprospiraceae bacterium]|nr:hypothetical protein [Lewinella sp.]
MSNHNLSSVSAGKFSNTRISIYLLAVAFLAVFSNFSIGSHPVFEPSCTGEVNININPNLCYAAISIANVLRGTYEPSEYDLELFDSEGNSLGDTIPGIYAGQTITAVVTHSLSNFSCTTSINVYDQSAPKLHVPEDIEIRCDQEPETALTGTATADDCTPVNITYEDEWSETFCGNPKIRILRIWTAVDALGLIDVDTQRIDIMRATAADIRFPPDVEISCSDYQADPYVINAEADKAGVPSLVDNSRCGLIYTHQDQKLPICGDFATSFLIIRKWTVLDACGTQIFTMDGAGNDNLQFIRVVDQTPPVIEPVLDDLEANVRKEDNNYGVCSSVGFIPPPLVTDECNKVTIRIYTAVGELEYVNGKDGAEGGYIPFPGLKLGGPHQIFYEVQDACGNISSLSANLKVIDESEPIMLCDSKVTVNLSLDGQGILEPFMIDEGSRDNCCVDKMQIRWVDESILSFRDRINIYCAVEPRQVVMRAWDCSGNFNDCVTTVSTHDPLPATIYSTPPELIEVDCGSDLSVFQNPQYQAPIFQDNCPMDIQFSIRDSINSCGKVDLWREWRLQDHPDHPTLEFGQLIHLIDNEAPFILPPASAPFCDMDGNCREMVHLVLQVSDNCDEDLTVSHRFSLDGGAFTEDPYGQLVKGIQGHILEGEYPVGEHEIYITAVDGCGNTSNGRYPLVVKDCSPPTLICRDNPEFIIGEDLQVVLSPEDFVASVVDSCNSFILSFANTDAENLLYTCDSLGKREVDIWATDSENNRSKCTVSFFIVADGLVCEPLGRLSGRITTETGAGVGMVIMELNGPDSLHTVTDPHGYFRFENVPMNVVYELSTSKKINPGNGVSVLDIIRISRHILGLEIITSPYQIIAADVNRSGNISILDIITARRVILGLDEYFVNNPDSWVFLPGDFTFSDPEHPLQERIPELINFNLILAESEINFTGIKYGDVNGSADGTR